jgi:putative transposase
MSSFFEFLATFKNSEDLPKFMQTLGRVYVRFYNKKYNRTGTLWGSRYKASLVQEQLYLFDVMKYIESFGEINSKKCNYYGLKDEIVTPHTLYKNLGFSDDVRALKYKEICDNLELSRFEFVKERIEKQKPTASDAYISHIETLVGKIIESNTTRGRPKKNIKNDKRENKKMYKNLVVLDKTKHKDLKVKGMSDLFFAKDLNFIPMIAGEVELVSKSFPVVFSGGENPSLIAITSLGGGCLAINSEGKWIESYVPSFLRRYPFSLASTQDNVNQKVILIDEDSALFSQSEGSPLFDENGEQSETLAHAIKFLQSYDNNNIVTQNVAKLISESGILEEREISVGEGEEKKVLVKGFLVVNKEKLNELSDDVLASWVRNGIINLIEAHLKSLENIQKLFEILYKQQI